MVVRRLALRSEDSAISSVTNKPFRIPIAHPILSLRSFSRISGGGLIEEDEWRRYPIEVRTELAADLPKIMADRVQLQQVLMNLMLNGIEAMKDSGGKLTVKSQPQDGHLQFSVSDTGVGLPKEKEKMEQMFSAFFTTKAQGSGMGLAISPSIVQSHGGRLWATANDGPGATFCFTLPIRVPESSSLVTQMF
jgi:signal transduction histidine kinase